MDSSSLSFANITNKTEEFDYYCGSFVVGHIFAFMAAVPSLLVGVPASVWLLWVLRNRPHTGLSNDIYILNITIIDLCFNISVFFNIVNTYTVQLEWILNYVWVTGYLSIGGKPLFITCVCGDYYLAVVHPIAYMKMKHCRYRMVVSTVIWVLALAQVLTAVLAKHLRTMSLWAIIPAIAVPAIVFCDAAILHTLRQPDPSGRTGVHPQKRRALQAIANSLVTVLLSYVPPLVSLAVSELMALPQQDYLCNVLIPSSTFCAFASTTLPLLHLHNLGSLQKLRTLSCV